MATLNIETQPPITDVQPVYRFWLKDDASGNRLCELLLGAVSSDALTESGSVDFTPQGNSVSLQVELVSGDSVPPPVIDWWVTMDKSVNTVIPPNSGSTAVSVTFPSMGSATDDTGARIRLITSGQGPYQIPSGRQVTARCDVGVVPNGGQITAQPQFYCYAGYGDATPAQIVSGGPAQLLNSSLRWDTICWEATLADPTLGFYVPVLLLTSDTPVTNQKVYVTDGIVSEQGQPLVNQPFVSGDTSGGIWEGTPGASSSVQIDKSRGPEIDRALEYLESVSGDPGAYMNAVNVAILKIKEIPYV